jgi:phage antirepressor YoqD-like protein
MNELMVVEGPSIKRMTSLEISELVESRHDSVKRTIERIASVGSIELPPMVEVKNHLGQSVKVYLLDKRSSLIVVAQLSPEFTARVVDRWQELEAQASAAVDPSALLNDPAVMRGLLLNYTEKVIALEATVAKQSPKVAALDRLTLADGMLNITNAAKTLEITPNQRLFVYLAANGWIYRRIGGKGWVGYQDRINSGYLTHKITTVQTSDGREKVVEQVLITPKGLARLAQVFSSASIAA